MVQIQVKQEEEEEQQFLYECQSTSEINQITRDVIEIFNLQTKIQRLVLALEPRLLHHIKDLKDAAAMPLMRALSEARSYASKDQILYKRTLSPLVLRDHIQTIEREVMVNQLMGFSDPNQLQELFSDLKPLQEDTIQLWWARKELLRDRQLCDYIGKNEKTKIILRLQSPGSGPEINSSQFSGDGVEFLSVFCSFFLKDQKIDSGNQKQP
ncbi:hypothetical protein HHK36_018989 [Tetracentron sinense]|uniref:Uncharacterized protein n=1 Tax=Tetracentron sinense TaxID=13715 RepID=A0A834YWM1_TETSI|nr:hypothetical protein HHK36_018989 [Tetracentron sinense]